MQRDARIAGLGTFSTPSLEVVERRRFQLWILTVVLLLALAGAVVLFGSGVVATPTWLTPHTAQIGLLLLIALFSVYSLEKELALRRLTRLLVAERVLTTALTNRVDELSSLIQAGKALNMDMDVGRVLASILASAVDLLEARDASVMLMRRGKELHTVATVGQSRAGGARRALGTGIAGRVAESGEAVLIDGPVTTDDDEDDDRERPDSAMCTPLVHRDEVVGVLNVNAKEGRSYSRHDLRALTFFAEQAAVAIANARLLENERLTATQGVFRALHDALTNLPNRALFYERLRHALGRRRDPDERVAVVFLDLKAFKNINDHLGHTVGDRVLVEIAERLRAICRQGDTVARLGGDEFAVLIDGVGSSGALQSIVDRLRAAAVEPFEVGEIEVELAVRLGVGVALPGQVGAEELVRCSDVALRTARTSGESVVYEDASVHNPERVMEVVPDVARAMDEEQLEVHYQPIFALPTRRIVGIEALLRWRHPELGLLSAESFIQEAEQSGLLSSIDLWTLDQACKLAGELDEQSLEEVNVHVNLLPTRLHRGDTLRDIKDVIAASRVAPERLVLEITENHLLLDIQAAKSGLEELGALGARIALDDFGTGYSSLSYLRSLPVSMVKMDRMFVQGLDEAGPATPLVKAILGFGKGLGLDVVAEGIESEAQLAALLELDCTHAQGFLLARPQPPSEIFDLLDRSGVRASD